MAYTIRTNIDPSSTSGTELADIVEEVGDLTQIVVESDTSNQPGGPSEGDAYIANGDASWVNGSQYDVAVFRDSTWIYHTPEEGWIAYIKDRGESKRFNGTDWSTTFADSSLILLADPEHATDSGTDSFVSAVNTTPPGNGVMIRRDFQSSNATTTPTLDSLTITTKDGSDLWANALSGVHELQLNAGGTAWLVLDPVPRIADSTQATSSITDNAVVQRDANGRAQFADPSAAQDAATKSYADSGDVTSGTAVDATNGGANNLTEIDFTSLKQSANRIVINLHAVSFNGTDDLLVQIGDSGGVETSGYSASWGTMTTDGANAGSSTSGFIARGGLASNRISGAFALTRVDGNKWVASCNLQRESAVVVSGGGDKELSGELDRLRVTPSGTDTFDGGTINILVE